MVIRPFHGRKWLIVHVFVLCVFLQGCAVPELRVCIKDGKEYCVNSDWIMVMDPDSCYRRGLSCMEGECWEEAINQFRQAISFLDGDERNLRPYGMFFRDYFPHREAGICHLHLGEISEALFELQLSLSQAPSARAKYYLNKALQAHLWQTGVDISPPSIDLEFSGLGQVTNKSHFEVVGLAQDDHYVASITVNDVPVFIELAEPSVPFTLPVNLKEGLNVIRVMVEDFMDRQVEESLKIFLDSQGPKVIINSIQSQKTAEGDKVLITAVVYDESGIVSFSLDQKEVQRLGSERICLIEEAVDRIPDRDSMPFRAEDLAGNITEGFIDLLPQRRKGPKHAAIRLACLEDRFTSLAMGQSNHGILFDLTYPPQEEFITCEPEISFEGTVEAENGISRIMLNDREVVGRSRIEALLEEERERIAQNLLKQKKDPEAFHQLLQKAIQGQNIKTITITPKISLMKGINEATLLVEDLLGNQEVKVYQIVRIPREEVFKSEQRMLLGLLPFDAISTEVCDLECREYVYRTIRKSFRDKERFNLVDEKLLEEMFSGDLINSSCQSDGLCNENMAQQIGVSTQAEGIVCGFVQKWTGGLEIDIRFREVEYGESCLFHDIFSPANTTEDLRLAISNLIDKFHDSFPPQLEGKVINTKGYIIQVDVGSEKGLIPCMRYNIFKEYQESELITKAKIRTIEEKTSVAEIAEKEKSKVVQTGFKARVR